MKIVREIAYAPDHGYRGLGDLYLPDDPQGAPAALVIHGGGWNHMDKHGLAGIAELMAECGYGAYNINYRLIDHAPWPGCGDDCLAAARFLLAGGHEAMAPLDRSRLVVIGASAGGHLALWTGLHHDVAEVAGIIAISGPADFRVQMGDDPDAFKSEWWRKFFGVADDVEIPTDMLAAASPVTYVTADAPPLLAMHSTRDSVVQMAHPKAMVAAYETVGARAELFAFEGVDDLHGIWIEGTDPHRLTPNLEEAIAGFLKTL
jgi:acetyl esterase/lipase